MTLDIIFQDKAIISVNKPADILSVKGKEPDKSYVPRFIEWENAIEKAACDSSNSLSEKAAEALRKLSLYKNIPRKEKSFYGYVERTLKVNDNIVLKEMWEKIVQVDELLHKTPLQSIPINLRSILEIVEDFLSTKVYSVHRLDCATSGVLLIAKSNELSANLCEQFKNRTVSKVYIAEVWGKLSKNIKSIHFPIRPDPSNKPKQVIDSANGKTSETRIKVISYRKLQWASNHSKGNNITTPPPPSELCTSSGLDGMVATTVVQLQPVTGRTHQLRVHLACIGHPIIGDTLYHSTEGLFVNKNRDNSFSNISYLENDTGEEISSTSGCIHRTSDTFCDAMPLDDYLSLRLHALSLKITHPLTQEELVLRALPCPFFHPISSRKGDGAAEDDSLMELFRSHPSVTPPKDKSIPDGHSELLTAGGHRRLVTEEYESASSKEDTSSTNAETYEQYAKRMKT